MSVPVQKILKHYFVNVVEDKSNNPNIYCVCPFHDRKKKKSKHNFSINRRSGLWRCFSGPDCGAGNIITFIKKISNCEFYQAKNILEDFYDGNLNWDSLKKRATPNKIRDRQFTLTSRDKPDVMPVPKNHPWLKKRKVSIKTARAFKLWYNPISIKYMLFPVFFKNKLCGVTRRHIGNQKQWLHDANMKKSLLLYNYDMAKPFSYVFVCEGMMDAMRIWSFGYRSVVATLGTTVSDRQIDLLIENWDKVVVAFDGDAAGFAASDSLCLKLAPYVNYVGRVLLPNKKDPDDIRNKRQFVQICRNIEVYTRQNFTKTWRHFLKK